jgi:DNA-binding transcriptional LysR family regulator
VQLRIKATISQISVDTTDADISGADFLLDPPPEEAHAPAQYPLFRSRRGAHRNAPVYEWAFERGGKSRKISVSGRVMVNDPDLAVRAAVDGLGIAYTITARAEPFLRSGQLIRVLED